MTGLVLRLAGPLQSWGEHSAFTDRDTQRFPTRSGLVGLFASALGVRRGEPLTRFDALRLTVRIDRPGVVLTDFHTVGGGRTRSGTVLTAEGKRRSVDTATIVTRRQYLSDAVFSVAVEAPDELLGQLADALAKPYWQPFLGRRSCPPDQPLLLRAGVPDPLAALTDEVPVPQRPPAEEDAPTKLEFVFEGNRDDADRVTELADVPISFAPLGRRFDTRAVSIVPREVSRALWHGTPQRYHEALYAYMEAA